MRAALLILPGLLLLASQASGQLTDLQPGRNFPTSASAFGTGRSENIDVGDVDNDGDYDVVIANGGDGGPQANRIYVNSGGLQGGTPGTFTDGTAVRFAGIPDDTSRDCEFADFDGDGDLDISIANTGTAVGGGEASRAYVNLGGLQAGTIGFFAEGTNNFWGNLVSVPPADEVGVQDGSGPWKDFSCDCDFGDLDDDGDLDLFHSSYGPNISGTRDSRIFLNDGTGVFDELWPWANAGADTKLHTLDVDLIDLDGDYDLDVFASSRNSQARVYRNNRFGGTGGGEAFTDVTQTALIAQGATMSGNANYEAESADVDGDGDFDVYLVNYNGNLDWILRNNGDFTFTQMNNWLKGDPGNEAREADFLDYDSDGDLDALVVNFSGSNWIYQSSLAQGLSPDTQGLLHRNGASGLAGWEETPASGNSDATLDGECADMDGDGDPDILLANVSSQQNRYWENVLGVPDTHAPTFHAVTAQGNKGNGTETVIRAALRDNAASYVVAYYDVKLVYNLNGGSDIIVDMTPQSGQMFRATIPAQVDTTICYHLEATDDAGNSVWSDTTCFEQGNSINIHGLPHWMRGGATASFSAQEWTITNPVPGQSAGVEIDTRGAPGLKVGFGLETGLVPVLDNGKYIELRVTEESSNDQASRFVSLRAECVGDQVVITPRLSFDEPALFTMQFLDGDVVVYEESSLLAAGGGGGGLGGGDPVSVTCDGWIQLDCYADMALTEGANSVTGYMRYCDRYCHEYNGATYFIDKIWCFWTGTGFTPLESPKITLDSNLSSTAIQFESLPIADVFVGAWEGGSQPTDTVLDIVNGDLVATGLDGPGSGLAVEFPEATFQSVDLIEGLVEGASRTLTSYGTVAGVPDQPIAVQQATMVGGEIAVAADFSALGTSTMLLEAYHLGALVYSGTGIPNGPAFTVASGPGLTTYKHEYVWNPPKIIGCLPEVIIYGFGFSVLADEVVLAPEGSPKFVSGGTRQVFEVSGIGSMSLGSPAVVTPEQFEDLGFAKPGTGGTPRLVASGELTAGSNPGFGLFQAKPSSTAYLVLGLAKLAIPFKGGVLVPSPDLHLPIPTNLAGEVVFGTAWPAGIPAGISIFAQYWIADAGAQAGFAASNGLELISQ